MNRFVKKAAVLSIVIELPDEFSIEELFEKLILLQKIELGQQDVAAGSVKSHLAAEVQLHKWLS